MGTGTGSSANEHLALTAAEVRPHLGQTSDWNEDDTVTVRFREGGIDEMCWHLVTWGESVTVVSRHVSGGVLPRCARRLPRITAPQTNAAMTIPEEDTMDLVNTLKQCPEPLPDWLGQPSPGFDRKDFFSSRTVYYPGFGNDGHPVSICARAHAAHAFVYVDYGVSKETVQANVSTELATAGFVGYLGRARGRGE